MKDFIKIILRGVGQVMFQNNAISGFIFLSGIFYNSWIMGIFAILGNLISTFFAYLFGYDKNDIQNGLYGFNGTLVGISLFFYFGFNYISIIALIFTSILSSVFMHEIKKRFPAFTSPFVFSVWIIIFILSFFNISPLLNTNIIDNISFDLFKSISIGFGQVMFQNNMITGLLFIFGIFINSKKIALYAIYGAILSTLISIIFSFDILMINLGIFSYNAILCSIALANNQKRDYIFITVAIILSVFITYLFNQISLIALTAPFVISTWFILYIKDKIYYKFSNSL